MGAQQQAQRQSMRAAYARDQAEKKAQKVSEALRTLQKASDVERTRYTTEIEMLNQELDVQMVKLAGERESLLQAQAEAAAAAHRKEDEALAEIRSLSAEVADLREKAVCSDAMKLTAAVLEEEVVTLRDRLDMSKAQFERKDAELRAVSETINNMLVTPQPREHAVDSLKHYVSKEINNETPLSSSPQTMRKRSKVVLQ